MMDKHGKMATDWAMIPARMLLTKNDIGVINFHCGDGSNLTIEECSEGVLWVGTVTDDDGKEIYGLHISTAEYPEEGSSTLVEFEAPVPPAGDVEVHHQYLCKGLYERWMPLQESEVEDAKREGFQVRELVDRAHVTRLTAECDGLLVDVGQANALIESHAQVIRDQEQLIQRQRVENEALTIQTNDLHGVVQRLNAARRRIRPDGSGSVVDQSAVVAVAELQSELTKARDRNQKLESVLAECRYNFQSHNTETQLISIIDALLTTPIAPNVDESCGQDAEAAKGGA